MLVKLWSLLHLWCSGYKIKYLIVSFTHLYMMLLLYKLCVFSNLVQCDNSKTMAKNIIQNFSIMKTHDLKRNQTNLVSTKYPMYRIWANKNVFVSLIYVYIWVTQETLLPMKRWRILHTKIILMNSVSYHAIIIIIVVQLQLSESYWYRNAVFRLATCNT